MSISQFGKSTDQYNDHRQCGGKRVTVIYLPFDTKQCYCQAKSIQIILWGYQKIFLKSNKNRRSCQTTFSFQFKWLTTLKTTQNNNHKISITASIIVIAVPIGCMFAGALMECVGRLHTIKLAMIPCIAGWIAIAMADNFYVLLIGRILTGLGCGRFLCFLIPSSYFIQIKQPEFKIHSSHFSNWHQSSNCLHHWSSTSRFKRLLNVYSPNNRFIRWVSKEGIDFQQSHFTTHWLSPTGWRLFYWLLYTA